MAGLVLIALAWILYLAFFAFSWKKTEGFSEDREGIQVFCNLIVIVGGIAVILGTFLGGFFAVTKVVNPEYYAIDRIISTVRGEAK